MNADLADKTRVKRGLKEVIATARLTCDRAYYEFSYDEWLKYRSRYRKHSLKFSIGMIIIGVGLWWIDVANLTSLLSISVGVFLLVSSLTHRWRDLRRMKGCDLRDCDVFFTKDSLLYDSERSRGELDYAGLVQYIKTPQSIFLIPQKGVSIFIPLNSIEPQEAIDVLMACLEDKVSTQ